VVASKPMELSTYGSNYIVCLKCFLIVGVRYISYGGSQTKVHKLIAVLVYARLKRKSWFIAKTQLVSYH
jgi:accessory gene regulator protein AgrB